MTSTEVIAESKTPEAPANDDVKVEGKESGGEQTAVAEPSPKKEPVPPKPKVHKKDYEKDTVYLYQFPRTPTIPSVSPFCLKVETFLRVTNIQYENVENLMKYKSKKGQLPFIELNGEEIPDSDVILKELSKKFDKDLNDGLTPEQKIQSHALESMLNNHTSWVVRYWRYSHPDEFLTSSQLDIKKAVNSKLPARLIDLWFRWNFKRSQSSAIGHGIGHHTPEEALELGKKDLESLSALLGTNDYFFGKQIHQLDVVAFAHLSQFVFVAFGGMKEWMEKETPNLISFVNRIKDKYWTDWDEICSTLEINTHLPKKELTAEEIAEQKKAEEKKAEEEKKKEEKKKEKEEKKKQKEEEKRKKQEEKEKKKKEAEEAKAKAKADAEAAKAKAKADAEAKTETTASPETAEKKDEENAPAATESAAAAAATATGGKDETENKTSTDTSEKKE